FPCAHRNSSFAVLPSIQPSAVSRSTNPAVHGAHIAGFTPRNPMIGSRPDCWATARVGQIVDEQPIVRRRKSRRCISPPRMDIIEARTQRREELDRIWRTAGNAYHCVHL